MFCPVCGRDNSNALKFCASCGTNLEAVSQALSGPEDNFFTKIDSGLDYFIARYSEHIFRNAPADALDHSVAKSWRLLGQGFVTSLVDILLFSLMWNVLPLRFLILLISTPVRLVAARGKERAALSEAEASRQAALRERPLHGWLPSSGSSVTEHTTMILSDSYSQREELDVKNKVNN